MEISNESDKKKRHCEKSSRSDNKWKKKAERFLELGNKNYAE